jgi:methionine sulfoxide reductase catalytic subunit
LLIRRPRGWEIPDRQATPEGAYRAFVASRRRFLGALAGAGAAAAIGCHREMGSGELEEKLGPLPPALDAGRNPTFTIDGEPTEQGPTLLYNNFYEFTEDKEVWRHVRSFEPRPWTVEVTGLVQKPRVWDIDEILALPLEERLYRHRCVEAWFMDVPWIGVPLRQLIEPSQPLSRARHVRFDSVLRPEQLPGQARRRYKWPYYEGLTLAEAMNGLTLATVGIYGTELPKQNGAPLRVVVPWKYGYKGPKSVVRIELVAERPRTFWNDLQPLEYGFLSNVNPDVPHPRWSQARERSIDGSPGRATRLYNGYAEWVRPLYG